MADMVKKNTVVYVKEEAVEGVYEAPVAGSEAVQVLEDGLEISPAKELVERSISTAGIGQAAGRPGQRSVTGTLPVEFKAGSSEGAAPEWSSLMKSALGGSRAVAAVNVSTADGATGSASQVPLADADKDKYKIGDTVKIDRALADAYIGAVTGVSNVDGSVSVTVSPALESGSFGDGDVIAAMQSYFGADSGHPSLSVTKEIEGAVVEKAIGCKVNSVSLGNFSTGQIADWSFGIEGLDFDRVLSSVGLSAEYDSSLPPLILQACVFVDGVKIPVNEVSLSVENTLAFKTSTCSPNGRISSRVTERAISGSFNPYKQSDDLSFFDRFNSGTKFDLFFYAYNPVSGISEAIGVYVPDCLITELGEADQDGLLQEAVSFQVDAAKISVSCI